jgi:hypothetical protein
MSRRRLLGFGAGAALGAGLSLALGGTARAAETAAPTDSLLVQPKVTWPIVANGWHGTLQFTQRGSWGNHYDTGDAWDVRGGIQGYAFGDPALFFGHVSGANLTFVRLCDPYALLFQIYRTTTINPDGSLKGSFWHYTYNPYLQRYNVAGPYAWSTTYGGYPWFLPLDGQSSQTYGVAGFHIQVTRDSYTWESFLDHRSIEDLSDRRYIWGRVFDNAIVGYGQQYSWATFSDAPTVASASAAYAFIRPLDTNFNTFQVYRGQAYGLRFTDNPAYTYIEHGWTGQGTVLPAVNIDPSGYQTAFTGWRSKTSFHFYDHH